MTLPGATLRNCVLKTGVSVTALAAAMSSNKWESSVDVGTALNVLDGRSSATLAFEITLFENAVGKSAACTGSTSPSGSQSLL